MEHKWLLENFNYAKNLIDEKNLPNCLIITGNKAIGKKDLAEEISKYYILLSLKSFKFYDYFIDFSVIHQ